MESLYIHFPFCETKCHYCDFYSLGAARTQPGDPTLFESALKREIELRGQTLTGSWDTIFFGGGTPSMTPPAAMERALEPLWKHSRITPATEWTMEGNPSSLAQANLNGYHRLGINRISMGVQSLDDPTLKILGRVHDRQSVFKSLELIFETGFNNVSVDLLCGIPGQTLAQIDAAIAELTRYPITHLSCYLLTLPPHHAMYQQLPDEQTQLAHLLHVDRQMVALGFEHYEISNFCKPGKRARHNLHYWTGNSYCGLGPSAHSFNRELKERSKNYSSLKKYAESLLKLQKIPTEWTEHLTAEQELLERWMLALRLADGFPTAWLLSPLQKKRAQTLQEKNYLEPHPKNADNLRLTPLGFALSDQIIRELAVH